MNILAEFGIIIIATEVADSGEPHESGQQARVILYGAFRHHGNFIANLKSEICNMKLSLYVIRDTRYEIRDKCIILHHK